MKSTPQKYFSILMSYYFNLAGGEKIIVPKVVKTFDVSVQYHIELSDDIQSFVFSTPHCRRFCVIFIVFIKTVSCFFTFVLITGSELKLSVLYIFSFLLGLGQLLHVTPLKTTEVDVQAFLDL
uniref:Uncharacterized protein n=1 Tax=Micrurus spixii TaxID=129469 RepID=A0A2D4M3C9_9SAUR